MAGYDPPMTIVLAAIATAFAAICIWFTMRTINRRERWAKWTLVTVASLPVLYVSSFGPCRRVSRRQLDRMHVDMEVFWSLALADAFCIWAAKRSRNLFDTKALLQERLTTGTAPIVATQSQRVTKLSSAIASFTSNPLTECAIRYVAENAERPIIHT